VQYDPKARMPISPARTRGVVSASLLRGPCDETEYPLVGSSRHVAAAHGDGAASTRWPATCCGSLGYGGDTAPSAQSVGAGDAPRPSDTVDAQAAQLRDQVTDGVSPVHAYAR
jgi:hypothetical protein